MPRITVIALHRVIDHHREEFGRGDPSPDGPRATLLFEALEQFDLLSCFYIREFLPVSKLAALVYGCESPAVGVLQILERSAKLAVDIVDDAGPRRARILIRRDDLIADGGERLRFIDREESPGSSVKSASDSHAACSGCRKCHFQKFPPAQFARFHAVFTRLDCTGDYNQWQ